MVVTLEQVPQRGYGLSIFGDICNMIVHIPEQPALADHSLTRGLDYVISRGPFQLQLFCCSLGEKRMDDVLEKSQI